MNRVLWRISGSVHQSKRRWPANKCWAKFLARFKTTTNFALPCMRFGPCTLRVQSTQTKPWKRSGILCSTPNLIVGPEHWISRLTPRRRFVFRVGKIFRLSKPLAYTQGTDTDIGWGEGLDHPFRYCVPDQQIWPVLIRYQTSLVSLVI